MLSTTAVGAKMLTLGTGCVGDRLPPSSESLLASMCVSDDRSLGGGDATEGAIKLLPASLALE